MNALPKLGDPNFAITCTNAPQASLGLVLLASTADPAGPDLFHLGIPIFVSTLSPVFLGLDAHSFGSGFAVALAPIPNIPLLAGSQFSAQALWVWPPFLCQPSIFGLSASGASRSHCIRAHCIGHTALGHAALGHATRALH